MELRLTLKVVKPYESNPSETYCSTSLIPTGEIDKAFWDCFLMDEFSEEVWDFFNTEFENILSEMISSISFAPRARYSLKESNSELRKLAIEEARKTARKYQVIYIFTDDNKNDVICRSDLDIESMMVNWVNNREDDCGSSIDVGNAMIKGMEKYIHIASWKSAMVPDNSGFKPIMWFGLDDEKPEEGWILNIEDDHETGSTWSTFWLCEDSWTDWLNRVSDADNIFLTWMTAECDMSLPELSSVLMTCPIGIDEKDDYYTLTQKIKKYIDFEGKR